MEQRGEGGPRSHTSHFTDLTLSAASVKYYTAVNVCKENEERTNGVQQLSKTKTKDNWLRKWITNTPPSRLLLSVSSARLDTAENGKKKATQHRASGEQGETKNKGCPKLSIRSKGKQRKTCEYTAGTVHATAVQSRTPIHKRSTLTKPSLQST